MKTQALNEIKLLKPQLEVENIAESIDKVFLPCYLDREPFGRIVRDDSEEPNLIWSQRRNYGYY